MSEIVDEARAAYNRSEGANQEARAALRELLLASAGEPNVCDYPWTSEQEAASERMTAAWTEARRIIGEVKQ